MPGSREREDALWSCGQGCPRSEPRSSFHVRLVRDLDVQRTERSCRLNQLTDYEVLSRRADRSIPALVYSMCGILQVKLLEGKRPFGVSPDAMVFADNPFTGWLSL